MKVGYAMKNSRVAILVIGALVAGLTLGGIGIASAANKAPQAAPASYAGTMMGATSPMATLSNLTGLSLREIMTLRAQGTSLAQIATDNGVDPAALVDQTVAARQTYLDSLVAAGRLTAAQEQTMLDNMRAAVTSMVNAVMGTGPGSTGATMTPPAGMMGSGTRGPRAKAGASGSTAGQRLGSTGTTPCPRRATTVPVPTSPAPGTAPQGGGSGPGSTTSGGPRSGMMGGSGSGSGSGMGMRR